MESKTPNNIYQILNNINQILTIITFTIIFSVSCLSLFLWTYDNSMDYDVKIISTDQQVETDYLIKKKYILYDLNPSRFEVNLRYNYGNTLDNTPEMKVFENNRDLFVGQHLETKVLTVTAEYSDGRSEQIDIYLHQITRLIGGGDPRYPAKRKRERSPDYYNYIWKDSSHDFKMSIPTGTLKYTYQFNLDLIKKLSLYYDLKVKHAKSAPKNGSLAEYLDILNNGRVAVLRPIFLLLAGWSLLSIMVALTNLNKSPPKRWRELMSKWFFSSPMRISIFLLIAYAVLVILINTFFLLMYALFGGMISLDPLFLVIFVFLLTLLGTLYPLLFTIGTFILVPWLYKKFGFWSSESWPMLVFSIGLAGILGMVLASWIFFNSGLSQNMSFYAIMTSEGKGFWLTVLLQGTSFLVRSPQAKTILNKISFWCCIVSFLLLFMHPLIKDMLGSLLGF